MIHVGPPKTGTTYLQSVLWDHKAVLREAGVLLPGRAPFDHNLVGAYLRCEQPGPRMQRAWKRVVGAVNAWPGTAVLSNEWFSLTSRRQAWRALAAFPGAEMHVVGAARDFRAVAPAAWQEQLKLGHASSLDDFVGSLTGSGDRWSWSTLDPARVLARWGAWLPRENVHVVTFPTPTSPPCTLWDRFAGVCGIPPGLCEPSRGSSNESIGVESAKLLEILGPRLRRAIDADDADWTEQYRWLRRFLGHQLLAPRGGSRIALRDEDAVALQARTRASVEALRSAGWRVVGDLAELTATAVSATAVHPDDVSDAALLEVAGDLVADLLRQVRLEARRSERTGSTADTRTG